MTFSHNRLGELRDVATNCPRRATGKAQISRSILRTL